MKILFFVLPIKNLYFLILFWQAGSVLVSWAIYPKIPDNLDYFARLEEGEKHGSQVVVFNAPPRPLTPNTGLRVWPVMLPKV